MCSWAFTSVFNRQRGLSTERWVMKITWRLSGIQVTGDRQACLRPEQSITITFSVSAFLTRVKEGRWTVVSSSGFLKTMGIHDIISANAVFSSQLSIKNIPNPPQRYVTSRVTPHVDWATVKVIGSFQSHQLKRSSCVTLCQDLGGNLRIEAGRQAVTRLPPLTEELLSTQKAQIGWGENSWLKELRSTLVC